ncbi:NHL repeat-containing protein, partial [Bacteriovoracaceae bacterium]|nr:NHL repeat-containing protein [Bacteriovoracaceae bacterium]
MICKTFPQTQLVKVYDDNWSFLFEFGTQGTGVGEYETLGMIKVTSSNKVYVSDQDGLNLIEYDLSGNFVAEHALEGTMAKPRDIGEDSSGNIYIADYNGSTIHKYDSSLTYITKFTGLNRPYSMSLENDLLNIGDRSNNRGIIMDTSGTVVTTLNSSTITGEAKSFSRVSSVHSLANGNFFIFDIDRMAVLDSGLNVLSEYQRYGDSINPLKLNAPEDLFVYDDKVFIADYNNDKIKVTDLYGKGIMSIGSSGSGNGDLDNPTDVVVAADGKIYVSEWLNHRISVFNSDGTWAFNFGSNGSGNGEFNYPCRLHITESKVFVSDSSNDRVQVFNLDGTYDTQFGTSGTGDGQFEDPCGITVDGEGNVFVMDKSGDARLQMFDSSYNFVREIARDAG